jgi:hypothetical protein
MRQDQYERLQAIEEQLVDVFLDEADAKNWPGAGLTLAAIDKHTRGDRYWCKKNAVATLSLAQRVTTLIGQVQNIGGTAPAARTADPELDEARDHLDAEIAAAEKEAGKLLAKVQRRPHGTSAG